MNKILLVLSLQFLLLVPPGYAQDTVHVKAGWNNIGAVATGAIGDVLASVPPGIIVTGFFGYDPGSGYQTSDTLEKGSGYWIKANADGIVIFNPAAVLDSCSTPEVAFEGGPYPTVKIGNQCWLAKNLNVGTMVPGAGVHQDNSILEKYCYNDDTANCSTYGGYYEWDEAMQYGTSPGSQGICPSGWHIPTQAEYEELSSAVAGDGNALKAAGQGSGGGAGTNTSGFSALLAGARSFSDGSFINFGAYAAFWSSTAAGTTHGWVPLIVATSSSFLTNEIGEQEYGFNVRCLQD
jgi:uncharacterized protein (TIGR02145 family)